MVRSQFFNHPLLPVSSEVNHSVLVLVDGVKNPLDFLVFQRGVAGRARPGEFKIPVSQRPGNVNLRGPLLDFQAEPGFSVATWGTISVAPSPVVAVVEATAFTERNGPDDSFPSDPNPIFPQRNRRCRV